MTNFSSNIDHLAKLDNSLAMSLALTANNVVLKVGSTYNVSTIVSIYNRTTSITEYKTVTGTLNTTNIDTYLASIKTQLELAYPIIVSHSTSKNINSVATFNTINVGLTLNTSGYYVRSMEMNISLSGVQQYSIDATLISPIELTPIMLNITPESVASFTAINENISSIQNVANDLTNINTVALNAQNINTVAGIQNIANITTVANDLNAMDLNGIADVTVVANDLVKGISSSISIASNSINSINTIAQSIANVNTVSASISNVNTTSSNISNINTVAANTAPINTVSANDTAIKYIALNSSTIDSIGTQIIPNIDEILLTPTNAATATAQAGIATIQAGVATTQALAAAASAVSALNSLNTLNTLNTVDTASDILTKIKTVDGTGSGLDADLLEGMQPLELPISTLTQSALDSKIPLIQKGIANGVATLDANGLVASTQLPVFSSAVNSVAGKIGVVTLVKADVGLNLVDNTSDANKPVSTATQTALDLKANLNSPVLVTPALGTPVSGVMTNVTGTAANLTSGHVITNANLTGHITSVGNATVLGSFTSAQLATALIDETGTGVNVFATSPTLVTPNIGAATGTSFNGITGLSNIAPNMDGVAAIGTSTVVAAADHIHPSDTSKSDLVTTVTKDSNTGAAYIPSGTTAQRPASPINGYMRYNSDLLAMEAYVNGAWGPIGGGATGIATVASSATTSNIWTTSANLINWTGTAVTTGFPAAPQAGAECTLITSDAAVFTAGPNMLIDGVASGLNLACATNDTVIVRAVTTTQFKLTRIKYDGTAQVNTLPGVTLYLYLYGGF
jgi:hypothetical protein